jgi:hypothetical protein
MSVTCPLQWTGDRAESDATPRIRSGLRVSFAWHQRCSEERESIEGEVIMVPALPLDITSLFAPIVWAGVGMICAGFVLILLAILLATFRRPSSPHDVVVTPRGSSPERSALPGAGDRVVLEASRRFRGEDEPARSGVQRHLPTSRLRTIAVFKTKPD